MKFTALSIALALGMYGGMATAQSAEVSFGAVRQDSSAPIEIASETLTVSDANNTVILTGDVIAVQESLRIEAEHVTVWYKEDQSAIDKIYAKGGVTLINGDEVAESREATYNVASGLIVMSGDVLMTQGRNAISAAKATINVDKGTARMEGRVRTILQPQ